MSRELHIFVLVRDCWAGDRERAVDARHLPAAEFEDPLLSHAYIPRLALRGSSHKHSQRNIFSPPVYLCRMVCYICLHTSGYIGEFEIIDDHRAGKIVVELTGRINKCGVISPRFDVQVNEIEKWIVNLLPSRQFGHILISTTYGIMTHEEARRKKTGGKILGFFY